MKKANEIKGNLKELRELIDNTDDIILARIAYEIETAVRWARENTVNWGTLVEQAKEATSILRQELKDNVTSIYTKRKRGGAI